MSAKRRAKTVLLFLNGELRDPKAVKALARRADALVCADGGARHAKALGLKPAVIVGDMDSLPRPLPKSWKNVAYLCDFDEDRSDLDKALDFVEESGFTCVLLAGALGGGLDHELVNLAALENRKGKLDVIIVGGGVARLLGPGRHVLDVPRGRRFSLLAAPKAVATLAGARYGLRRENLTRGTRGLGNRATGRAVLTVHSGRVWLMVTPASAK